mgnify:CR=1 FL=1
MAKNLQIALIVLLVFIGNTQCHDGVVLLPRRGYCVGGSKNRCSSVRSVSFRHVTKSADRRNQTCSVTTCEGTQKHGVPKLTSFGPGGKIRAFRWFLNYSR